MYDFAMHASKDIETRRYLTAKLSADYKECIDDALFTAENYTLAKGLHRDMRYALLQEAYKVCLHVCQNAKPNSGYQI